MASEGATTGTEPAAPPVILTVPGLGNSGAGHWQTLWEQHLPDCHRVDLGLWDDPHRNTWVGKLALAVGRIHDRTGRQVVLAAHSLGCFAVAWWAAYEAHDPAGRAALARTVAGALLVAPPEVESTRRRLRDRRLTRFAPVPPGPFPFPTLIVASRNDPYATFGTAHRLAEAWGADLADAGEAGHINAASGLGRWDFGLACLARVAPPRSAAEGSTPVAAIATLPLAPSAAPPTPPEG